MWQPNFKEDIIPLTEFGADPDMHLKKMYESGRPLLLTQEGRCVVVAMPPALFDNLIKKEVEGKEKEKVSEPEPSTKSVEYGIAPEIDGLSPVQRLLHACILCGMTLSESVHRHQLIYAVNFVLSQKLSEQSVQRQLEDGLLDGFLCQKEEGSGRYLLTKYGFDSFQPVSGFESIDKMSPAESPQYELRGTVADAEIVFRRVSRNKCVTVIGGLRYLRSDRAIEQLAKLDPNIVVKGNRSQAAELFNIAVERNFVGTWLSS